MKPPGQLRRELNFTTLDAVVQDAEALLAQGYDRLGKWTLGQCCGHLANWMRYPIDGYPPVPMALKPFLWLMRLSVGASFRKKMLGGNGPGKMDANIRTLSASVPPADIDDAAAVQTLREAVTEWTLFTGPVIPSPLLGPMTLQEATRIQLIHCAHHLSFLIPKTNPAMTGPA